MNLLAISILLNGFLWHFCFRLSIIYALQNYHLPIYARQTCNVIGCHAKAKLVSTDCLYLLFDVMTLLQQTMMN